jgi:hypothetical protein
MEAFRSRWVQMTANATPEGRWLLAQLEETPFLTSGFVLMLLVVIWSGARRLVEWLVAHRYKR